MGLILRDSDSPPPKEYTSPVVFEEPDSYREDGLLDASETELRSLNMQVGDTFEYLFDFGASWWHQGKLISVDHIDSATGANPPAISERHGESPEQYPEREDEHRLRPSAAWTYFKPRDYQRATQQIAEADPLGASLVRRKADAGGLRAGDSAGQLSSMLCAQCMFIWAASIVCPSKSLTLDVNFMATISRGRYEELH